MSASVGMLSDVRAAVRLEHRATGGTVRLVCLAAERVNDEQHLFRLAVGEHADFDWTWEGATAWCPDDAGSASIWRGEVVEVDEGAGQVYVAVVADGTGGPRPRGEPRAGAFLVTPFGFLEALHRVYEQADLRGLQPILTGHLLNTLGRGQVESRPVPGEQAEFAHLWSRSWSWLWGPPGTGKTYSIGLQVAHAMSDPAERILVVSTTNKATDGVAVSIGVQAKKLSSANLNAIRRVGSGADVATFCKEGLDALLQGTASWARWRLSELRRRYEAAHDAGARAGINAEIQEVRRQLSQATSLSESAERVIVATSFMGLREAASVAAGALAEAGRPPFTTVVIDEAGLISRAAVAALALLASRRVILVGDPRQLSPISRMARALPSQEAMWLAESGLGHLESTEPREGVHLLTRQYRMHPEIRVVVSRYQYDGKLEDGDGASDRPKPLDPILTEEAKAIWYVLDEEAGTDPAALPRIRADRGPGNKSWLRRASVDVVERILRYHPRMREGGGLFISPFVAQTRMLAEHFAASAIPTWTSSTAHKQQGAEAPFVIFDTVNAGSTGWSDDEWRRLINVGMSRAKQVLIVLASRLEMQQPYMQPLLPLLAPRVFRGQGGQMGWRLVDAEGLHTASARTRRERPWTLGAQLETRRAMRPVFSEEQERLSVAKLDGGPRLVRGVAGSGKTVVLARWLARTLSTPEERHGQHWVVYGNTALKSLLDDNIQAAWQALGTGAPLPARRLNVLHIGELLGLLEGELECRRPRDDERFDYDLRARRLLERTRLVALRPRARSLFIDEAQDMGPHTMQVLSRIVEQREAKDPNSRAIKIFYDNAQNLYGRATPNWKEIGLDMRGRSTVMKESFRATRPITELALNVLARLRHLDEDADHKELVERGLVELEHRNGRPWWRVRYNHVEGPAPVFRSFPSRSDEIGALVTRIRELIAQEGVAPGRIRVIASFEGNRAQVTAELKRQLSGLDVMVEEQTSQTYSVDERTLVVTTAHSFKGHEAEVVFVATGDAFVAPPSRGSGGGSIMAEALYVALTRARTVLHVSAVRGQPGTEGARVHDALRTAAEDLGSPPAVPDCPSPLEQRLDLVARIGEQHRGWLETLWKKHRIERGPIMDRDRAILAEPLFWFEDGAGRVACFAEAPPRPVCDAIEELGFRAVVPGGVLG